MKGFTKTLVAPSALLAMIGCSKDWPFERTGNGEVEIEGTSLQEEMSNVSAGMANGTQEKKDSPVRVIAASRESEHKAPLSEALAVFGITPGSHLDSVVSLLWVYFPVTEHLDRARKGEDYGVAFQSPFADDVRLRWIPGFSPQGQPMRFFASQIPSFPVLVMTFEPPDPPESSEGAQEPETDTTGGSTAVYHQLMARAMKLYISPEPWWLGALEIHTWWLQARLHAQVS